MNKILSMYSGSIFKEYILPSINNSDYTIALDGQLLDMKEDIMINLEVIEEEWRFLPSESYRVFKENIPYENQNLQTQDLLKLAIDGRDVLSIIVTESQHIFVSYDKYLLRPDTRIMIGRTEDCAIRYEFRKLVSKNHASIYCNNGRWIIEDASVNGTYVNGNRIKARQQLAFGDYINIVGLHMVFLGDILAVDTSHPSVQIDNGVLPIQGNVDGEETISAVAGKGKAIFHRSPRNILSIDTEPVSIEAPPAPEKENDMPLMMSIGPSLTMAFPMLLSCTMMIVSYRTSGNSRGIMMYTGLIMAVASASIGIFWNLKNRAFHKKQLKEKEIHRFEAYSQYLMKKTDEIKNKYEQNMKAMRERYVSAEECVLYDQRSKELWGRNAVHSDFMHHRIGIGDVPFQAAINVPTEKFTLLEDGLTDKPNYIYNNYKTLYKVPITIDLEKHRLIGLVGGRKKVGALQLARVLTAQIAANNCYSDVKLGYIYDQNNFADEGQWDYVRWLPHVWIEDRKLRLIASDKKLAGDVFFTLTNIMRQREELSGDHHKEVRYKPQYVLFISDPALLEGELLAKYVFDENNNYGLTTFLLVERQEELPNECRFILENTDDFHGFYDTLAGVNDRTEVEYDNVSVELLDRFSRKLANVEVVEVEEGGEIPNSMTFFEMYHVNSLEEFNVIDRWKKNKTYDNIKGLLGEKAGGKPCYLDVHEKYHGPHGLVAGMTGSGKSETLQTYLLSLAINYSPYDIGLFIIDYKGGGMANLFDGLPHLIGSISNLSGNQVHRAMVSIKSENRRRQQIFNQSGVNNINNYTRLYKNGEVKLPVPHLFIVIDEFAELKREEPDFMRELISVAQVGRSLGVHLILATQKPSGTVDDNIWSNSKFRLCLRVQDRQDSNDMLHKPDAAYITQAGRAYLQVGNDEVFELFQSGYSGAVYVDDDTISKTDVASLLDIAGRETIKGSYAKSVQKKQLLRKWLGVLQMAYQHALETKGAEADNAVIHEAMYTYLENNNIEYPRSDFNNRRLQDFVSVYKRAEAMDGDVVDHVMAIAVAEQIKLPQQKDKTQLDAVKEYLAAVAEENGYNYNLKLWMPVLPQYLYLREFAEYRNIVEKNGSYQPQPKDWQMRMLVGKVDDPNNQSQMPYFMDIAADGHVAVCGSATSGKSTFLQTLIYSMIHTYSPQYVNIYAIDFSSKLMSAFENAPHVGGVMYEDDYEKIAKLFNMMNGILRERKQLFHGGNYSQFVKVHGVTVPAIFIVIDNFSAFNEKTEEKYIDFLIQLSKEGLNHGIFLVIGAAGFGRSEIPNRLADNILNIVALQQQDKFSYGDLLRTMKFDVIPETGVKGRGLVNYSGRLLEFQTALAVEASDDYQRMEQIQADCERLRDCWNGKRARQIPVIPEKPVWSEFAQLEEVEKLISSVDMLPVGYNAENADIYALNMRQFYTYLIMGAARTGKKNYMRILVEVALRKSNSHVIIMDTPGRLLRTYETNERIRYITDDEGIYDFFTELIPTFKQRNKAKNDMLSKDYDEDEIFSEQIKTEPYFIFITDLSWFFTTVHKSEIKMEGFLNNIFEKGRIHNIYFIGNIDHENYGSISGNALFRTFAAYKTGIHFGGKVSDNAILSFDHMNFREQSKVQKPGVANIPTNMIADGGQLVIVPLAKGRKND